jgi:ATP-binding cassette subfamily C protein LapB
MGMTMAARPASAGVMASHMKEFETLRDFFTSTTMAALVDLPFTVLFIVIIFAIGGPMALVPLIAIPMVVGVGWLMQGPMQKVIRQSMNESALKNALLFETITGLETIKSQAAESHAQRRWEELTEKSSRTSVKSRKLSSLVSNCAVFIQQVASAVVVIVGVYLVNMENSPYTMGSLIACVILTGRALAPLAQVAGLMTRLNQSKEALRNLDAMMKKPVERPAGKHFISIPNVKGKIDFKDVVFHYPGQTRPALNGITFSIEPGEHIGVIGAVGSGKTTLERLLHNLFQPDSGTVQLDGTDVRQIDPGDLRRNIGVVQQSPQLFYGSIRENITMGHEMATESALLRAAEMAGVLEFIKDSETGLDTPVGERGEALSGGQRQAVAVARALLYDPSVLILDEPTASMDPASENRLRQRLGHITEGRTVILITHKGAMLSLVDKLILMDKGRLVAFGPKDEIIKRLQNREFGTDAENTKV